VASLSSE